MRVLVFGRKTITQRLAAFLTREGFEVMDAWDGLSQAGLDLAIVRRLLVAKRIEEKLTRNASLRGCSR